MKPVSNIIRLYICPNTVTCRNNHIWPDGFNNLCNHYIPHIFGRACGPGVCGEEFTQACESIDTEEVLE